MVNAHTNLSSSLTEAKNPLHKKEKATHYESIISALAEHASDAEKSIESRAEELEEAFLNIVFYLFNKHVIDRNEKIVISLTEAGTLEVNEHPQQEKILKLLEKTPQCLKIMQRLAADALLKQGLQKIKFSHDIINNIGKDSHIIFQSSIKNDLSHFYLV